MFLENPERNDETFGTGRKFAIFGVECSAPAVYVPGPRGQGLHKNNYAEVTISILRPVGQFRTSLVACCSR